MSVESPPPVTKGQILVIDDEPVVADVLEALLVKEGFRVEVAMDASTGRARLDGSEDFLEAGHVLCGTPKIYAALAKQFGPAIREMFAQ